MSSISVNLNKKIGKMKVMHAINNGPYVGTSTTLWKEFKEAGIPYSRLHDTGGAYGGAHYVDIPNIFPNFDADVSDPNSYDFAFTDVLLKKIVDYGAEPFYRLGVTIENDQRVKAYGIYPPKDFNKWAEICEHVIMHYNEGWANGFHFNIKYWEIWNEPDNELDPKDNPMWKGSRLDYFKLYEITSNRLKKRFPDLKIGGYASCGFYEILNNAPVETAHISTRTENFIEFFKEFLDYITSKEHLSPLDFFSWHSYGRAEHNIAYAKYAREVLDSYGFKNTESILNEWNPGIMQRGKIKDASNILNMMCSLQNSSLDMLMYYDGNANSSYCGIFNPVTKKVFKAYYAFKYFSEAYNLKDQIELNCDDKEINAVASFDGKVGAIVIANTSDCEKQIKLNVKVKEIKITDGKHKNSSAKELKIGRGGIALIKF